MSNYFDKCKLKHGFILHNGIEFALMGDAYFESTGTSGNVAFFASAFSRDQLINSSLDDDIDESFDVHILIEWNCTNWWNGGNNDGDCAGACDWDNPKEITLINGS